jgi:KDO2-lipid IV(A) lauroyltransferase
MPTTLAADESPPRKAPTAWQRVEFAVMRVWFALVGVLPEALSYRAMAGLGSLYVRCSARRRRVALRLLRNAYPDERDERKLVRLARLGTGNLLKVALDMVLLGRMVDRGRFGERIDMGELESLGLEPPWIGVTGHLGSWECGAVGVARLGVEAHVTARLMKNPLAQRFLLASRRRAGLVIHDRRGGIRGIVAALRDGHVVMQVVDQNQRLRGMFVPFFGELASTERAAAVLAVRNRLPVLVAAGVRVGIGFRFRFVVQELLRPEDSGDHDADVERLLVRMNLALEALILRFPEQYLWIHDRYRTRPEGKGAEPGRRENGGGSGRLPARMPADPIDGPS